MAAAAIPTLYAMLAGAGGGTLTAGSVALAGTVVDAGIAYGASQALKPKMPSMPPSPFTPQAQVDQTTQDAEAQARRRQGGAQGIEGTLGTSGGGSGALLNPSSVSSKNLLGQ